MRSVFILLSFALLAVLPLSAQAASFDGTYQFIVKTSVGTGCSASPGQFTIVGNKFSGTLLSEGSTFRVDGKVSDDGTFSGKVKRGLANFKGKLTGRTGSGTWKNNYGCRGTVTIR